VPSLKKMIHKSMTVSELAVCDLEYDMPPPVLQAHQCMLLVDADRDVYLAAHSNLPEPSNRLVNAIRRSRSAHS
jgi:hypothetical protein